MRGAPRQAAGVVLGVSGAISSFYLLIYLFNPPPSRLPLPFRGRREKKLDGLGLGEWKGTRPRPPGFLLPLGFLSAKGGLFIRLWRKDAPAGCSSRTAARKLLNRKNYSRARRFPHVSTERGAGLHRGRPSWHTDLSGKYVRSAEGGCSRLGVRTCVSGRLRRSVRTATQAAF